MPPSVANPSCASPRSAAARLRILISIILALHLSVGRAGPDVCCAPWELSQSARCPDARVFGGRSRDRLGRGGEQAARIRTSGPGSCRGKGSVSARRTSRPAHLLRSDIHTLFDRGYVTVTPESRFLVSKRIREEFENGRLYYDLDGREVQLPVRPELRPSGEYLDWHASNVFRG